MDAKQFRNDMLGKAVDVDKAAGVQCVDLFKEYCRRAGKSLGSLGGSGYAFEIIHRFDQLGLGTLFQRISIRDAMYGDWVIWGKGAKECPVGHVAMFEAWDGTQRAIVLGQNQRGISKANEGSFSISGVIGVLRLKAIKPTDPVMKSLDVIVKEVLQGKWGNGAVRRDRLRAAGYSYEQVQARINQKK